MTPSRSELKGKHFAGWELQFWWWDTGSRQAASEGQKSYIPSSVVYLIYPSSS